MQLLTIDKARYRQHLNRITVASIAVLTVLSLAISSVLIILLSDGQGSNFYLNLTGVVIAAVITVLILKKLKTHPYFNEVAYIWDLKHELNLIQRKIRRIDAAAAQNNPDALLILAFSYAGSALIWQLDNNTLMMSELNIARNKLQQQIEAAHLQLDVNNYSRNLLNQF
ncbi:DUF3087 family protein [Chromatiaceae bacterium AAb-1]|nr:DUF3087 family protein [Chromatiaceae bacterium AAb-1]